MLPDHRENISLLNSSAIFSSYVDTEGTSISHQDSAIYRRVPWPPAPQVRVIWKPESLENIKLLSEKISGYAIFKRCVKGCFEKLPGLLIAVLINLLQSIASGLAFFPSTWDFPADIPRTLGCQMFLFSTLVCQIVLTSMSEFPTAAGMQMIENIPFMHTICNIQQGGLHTLHKVSCLMRTKVSCLMATFTKNW